MLIQPKKGLLPIGGALLVFIVVAALWNGQEQIGESSASLRNWWEGTSSGRSEKSIQKILSGENAAKVLQDEGIVPTAAVADTHHELFSLSTPDGKYFDIVFGRFHAINPNVIPHPSLNDTWFIIGQEFQKGEGQATTWNIELVCEATFRNSSTLQCIEEPIIAPVAATYSPVCHENYAPLNFNIGPHDARVFFGPEHPYMIFGSQSQHSCFGQWIEDFRLLSKWPIHRSPDNPFQVSTDIQRPPPFHPMEKNWFVFWDTHNDMYVHYDTAPKRSYAKLAPDGSVGGDLALLTEQRDSTCLAKYLPNIGDPAWESIHQATNSLAITLCRRTDVNCVKSEANTFILTIYQHKGSYSYHSAYEPYTMLFKQIAPFEIYAMGTKPLFIHGRLPGVPADSPTGEEPRLTEMFYLTSISWKSPELTYHGYLDDVMFVNFGIEDTHTGGIDVLAADVIAGLGYCDGKGAVAMPGTGSSNAMGP
ncbi:hypothetical protein EJ03DRAFT_38810 [Teratosphaeria nubilosa]|uniref:Uncharacterized protein n=1 Tax=Teratosphaeria nubilosa TaxID=161662 RepID=A0A6G1LGM1_9PEZI|nr:hypothetical protein EJ03DRAFT_38810 [Teratosphaeria nubilosa]